MQKCGPVAGDDAGVGWVEQRETQRTIEQARCSMLGFALLNPTYESARAKRESSKLCANIISNICQN